MSDQQGRRACGREGHFPTPHQSTVGQLLFSQDIHTYARWTLSLWVRTEQSGPEDHAEFMMNIDKRM